MELGAYELPEIAVTARSAKPIEYAWTTRFDDFFRRQQVGLGHYISRADIDRKKPLRTPSLLHGIPGVRIRMRHMGMGGTDVWFRGCTRISVWVDGFKQHYGVYDVEPPFDPGQLQAAITGALVERLFPSQIEMIEVYTNPAEMPAEFLDDSCGAIAIWTR
jgi:hypothetical protein